MRRAEIPSRCAHPLSERRASTTEVGDRAICLIVVLSLGVAGLVGCEKGSEPPSARGADPSPAVVEAVIVEPRLLIDTVALTGQLEAEHSVLMKPEIDGVVATIDFVEGLPISKGAVLITLRDDVQQARVKEAQAERRLAEQVFERENKLARRDASSIARIEEARAKLDTTQARLRLAEIQLDRTRIRAPFDGTPGALLVAPGARVEEFDGLVPFDSIDRLQVLFTVTENAIGLAQVGEQIHVRVVAWPGERFPGEVFFVSPTVDPAARRLVLKAWVPNPDHRLKPGMFTNVDVQIAEREAALSVPEAAMVYDRNGSYVWRVAEGDVAEKVPVRIGLRSGGTVEIVEGLRAGDAVISAGTHKVIAGRKLRLVKAPDASQALEELSPAQAPIPQRQGEGQGKES
jgi:membrane fusion protein (multidrug efflux system)